MLTSEDIKVEDLIWPCWVLWCHNIHRLSRVDKCDMFIDIRVMAHLIHKCIDGYMNVNGRYRATLFCVRHIWNAMNVHITVPTIVEIKGLQELWYPQHKENIGCYIEFLSCSQRHATAVKSTFPLFMTRSSVFFFVYFYHHFCKQDRWVFWDFFRPNMVEKSLFSRNFIWGKGWKSFKWVVSGEHCTLLVWSTCFRAIQFSELRVLCHSTGIDDFLGVCGLQQFNMDCHESLYFWPHEVKMFSTYF